MTKIRFTFVGVVLLFSAHGALGQLTTDVVPQGRLIPKEQQIQRDLETARYRLGPFRLQPLLTLRDIGYSSNVFGTPEDPISDWSATVSTGVKWTLPFGPKMYFRGEAAPEYTWFNELAERRFLGGTYSASALALFNRLSIEANAETSKELSLLNSETEAPAIRRLTDLSLDAEVDVLRRLSVFGRGQTQRHRYRREEVSRFPDLTRLPELDRDDSVFRAGVRYRFSTALNISMASETSRSEFTLDPSRDNESKALLLGVHYERPRMYLNLTGGKRDGEPIRNSDFRPYSTTTGSYYFAYTLVAPLEVRLQGQRRVRYGLFESNPYFFETRNGVAVLSGVGRRLALRAFADVGENEYPTTAAAGRFRTDKVLTYGGGFIVRTFRNMALTVIVSQTEYDSNFDNFDRSVIRVQSGLTLRGDFPR